MIVTDKFIFVNIPKTGTTSLLKSLVDAGYNSTHQHHTLLRCVDYQNKEVITFTRNPYSWLWSFYNYCIHIEHYMSTKAREGFTEWLKENIKRMQLDCKCIEADKFYTQSDYIYTYTPIKINWFKFEEYQKGIDEINRLTGFGLVAKKENSYQYPSINISKEAIELINIHFKEDFINFNYKKI